MAVAYVRYNYRITWDVVDQQEYLPDRMSVEFEKFNLFREHLELLREAEAENMCRNIQVFRQLVMVEDWERWAAE